MGLHQRERFFLLSDKLVGSLPIKFGFLGFMKSEDMSKFYWALTCGPNNLSPKCMHAKYGNFLQPKDRQIDSSLHIWNGFYKEKILRKDK